MSLDEDGKLIEEKISIISYDLNRLLFCRNFYIKNWISDDWNQITVLYYIYIE